MYLVKVTDGRVAIGQARTVTDIVEMCQSQHQLSADFIFSF